MTTLNISLPAATSPPPPSAPSVVHLALAAVPPIMPTLAPRRVAIVGGGFAGLAAFHRLRTTITHVAFIVELFEASDRLGGRVRPIEWSKRRAREQKSFFQPPKICREWRLFAIGRRVYKRRQRKSALRSRQEARFACRLGRRGRDHL